LIYLLFTAIEQKYYFAKKKQQLINQYCFNWFMYQFYTIFIPVCFYWLRCIWQLYW